MNIEGNLIHILSENDYEVLFEHIMKLYYRFERILKEGKITEVKNTIHLSDKEKQLLGLKCI